MTRLASAVLATCLFTAPAAAAQSNFGPKGPQKELRPVAEPRATHQVGEKLEFDVYWMGFHVGLGSLEVRERVSVRGRDAFHVVAIARTNYFLTKLYPVEDEIHSFIDAEHHHSLEFRKKLSERNYRADERIVFNYARKKGEYESFRNGEKKEVDIPVPVHDLVSAFYWFRLQSPEPGKSIHTVVSSEEKNYDLEIAVLRRESAELRGGGVVDAVVVEPKSRLKGVLYARGRAWVHFSADERRIPVKFTLKTPFGPVTGVLKDPESVDTRPQGV